MPTALMWRSNPPMRFLLASLYRPEFRAITDRVYVPPGLEPMVLHVACPGCSQDYVAELGEDVDPWDMEESEYKAIVRLHDECPDHPHRFVVQV